MTRKRAIKLLMSVAGDGCAHQAAFVLDNIHGKTNQHKVLFAMLRWMVYALETDNVSLFAKCNRALRAFGWYGKLEPHDGLDEIVISPLQRPPRGGSL